MGFSREEYWSGLSFPCPVNLPDPGIKPRSPALQAQSLPSEPPGKPLFCLTRLQIISLFTLFLLSDSISLFFFFFHLKTLFIYFFDLE